MHAGELVSLTDAEQRALLEFAIKQCRRPRAGHRPCERCRHRDRGCAARHAQGAGAAAIVATTPYYWTPPPAMVLEHFAQIGSAVDIPFFVYNSPEEMPGTKITAELCLKLIDRLPNFAGVVDLSLDWQFMIELMTYARQETAGFPAARRHRAYGVGRRDRRDRDVVSPFAGVAPKLVRELYDDLPRGSAVRGARRPGADRRDRPIW